MNRDAKRFLRRIVSESKYGLCPEPTTYQEAVHVFMEYVHDENLQIAMPMSTEQTLTLIVHDMLYHHSRRYRRDIRRIQKRKDREVNG